MPEKKRGIPAWFRTVFSLVVMGAILYQVDLAGVGSSIIHANPFWLCVGFIMIFLEQLVVAIAWRGMVFSKADSPPLITMLHIMFVANYLGFIFPSTAGSDVMKVVGLSKYTKNSAEALSSLFIFRVIGHVVLFLIALTAATLFSDRLPEAPLMEAITVALFAILAALVVGAVAAKPALRLARALLLKINLSGVYAKLKEIYDAFGVYIRRKPVMIKAVAGSLFMQVDRILYVWVIAMALGLDVDPVALCVFVPVITVITMIPVSISGIGVREGGYVVLFAYAGLDASQALSLSVTGFALDIVYVLLGGVVYWLAGFPSGKSAEDIMAGKTAD